MREILFRGKRLQGGNWVEGYFFKSDINKRERESGKATLIFTPDCDTFIMVPECHNSFMVVSDTVGQYTGLKDKNGKRIFEDDVCRFREWSKGEMCWFGKVHFEHQQFMISGGPNKECETMFELCMSRFIPENIEVIGNIRDNPELLKEEAQP